MHHKMIWNSHKTQTGLIGAVHVNSVDSEPREFVLAKISKALVEKMYKSVEGDILYSWWLDHLTAN